MFTLKAAFKDGIRVPEYTQLRCWLRDGLLSRSERSFVLLKRQEEICSLVFLCCQMALLYPPDPLESQDTACRLGSQKAGEMLDFRDVCVKGEGVSRPPVYLLSRVPKHYFIGQWLP